MADTSFGEITQLTQTPIDIYTNLIYLIEKDHNDLIEKYNAIRAEKNVISAYSINGRHCLVLSVDGRIKKIIKKKPRR